MKSILQKALLPLMAAATVVTAAGCKEATGPQNYNVAGAASDIPTITSVVGDREFVGSSVTRYAKAEQGNLSVTCAYSGASDPEADINAYSDVLVQENDFTVETAWNGRCTVLTAPSTIEGQHLQITVTMTDDDGYTVLTEIVEDETE
jgi:hypothetical protein